MVERIEKNVTMYRCYAPYLAVLSLMAMVGFLYAPDYIDHFLIRPSEDDEYYVRVGVQLLRSKPQYRYHSDENLRDIASIVSDKEKQKSWDKYSAERQTAEYALDWGFRLCTTLFALSIAWYVSGWTVQTRSPGRQRPSTLNGTTVTDQPAVAPNPVNATNPIPGPEIETETERFAPPLSPSPPARPPRPPLRRPPHHHHHQEGGKEGGGGMARARTYETYDPPQIIYYAPGGANHGNSTVLNANTSEIPEVLNNMTEAVGGLLTTKAYIDRMRGPSTGFGPDA